MGKPKMVSPNGKTGVVLAQEATYNQCKLEKLSHCCLLLFLCSMKSICPGKHDAGIQFTPEPNLLGTGTLSLDWEMWQCWSMGDCICLAIKPQSHIHWLRGAHPLNPLWGLSSKLEGYMVVCVREESVELWFQFSLPCSYGSSFGSRFF